MRLTVPLLLAALPLFACCSNELPSNAPQAPAATVVPTPAARTTKTISSYQEWFRATEEPRYLSYQLATLCMGNPGGYVYVDEDVPHAERGAHIYLNEIAKAHHDASEPFGTGAIIVQELLVSDAWPIPALSIMTMEENGKWEYTHYDPEVTKSGRDGDLQGCVDCHRAAPGGDEVWGWDSPEIEPSGRYIGESTEDSK